MQVYTGPTSFTWSVPAGATMVRMLLAGGGGGGGSGFVQSTNNVRSGGGGGGAAGVSWRVFAVIECCALYWLHSPSGVEFRQHAKYHVGYWR